MSLSRTITKLDADIAHVSDQDETRSETVQIVDRALLLLNEIARDPTPRGVRELSRALDISKSSVQRLLTSLQHFGFVTFDDVSKKYNIGPGTLSLSWRYTMSSDIVNLATKVIPSLAEATGETICLSTISGGARVAIYEVESPQPLRLVVGVGRPYSLLGGATGRVLLSLLEEQAVDTILKRSDLLIPPGGRPAQTKFKKLVRETRERGYEFSKGEWLPGGAAISFPVGVREGAAMALSLYGPDSRLTDANIRKLLAPLGRAAKTLASMWLGKSS